MNKESLKRLPAKARKFIAPVLMTGLALGSITACRPEINIIDLEATPTMSAAAGSPTPEPMATAVPTVTPRPTETPVPTPTRVETECDVRGTTSLPERPSARVNGVEVRLQVRDTNNCLRPLFYSETGIAKGQNYTLDLPKGWSVITASISAAVQREGGVQKNFFGTPLIVINGPFVGGVGLYEGSLIVVPTEWVNEVTFKRLEIHRTQTNKPDLTSTRFTN